MPRKVEKFVVELTVDGEFRSYHIDAIKGDVAERKALKEASHFYPEADIRIVRVVHRDKY